MKSYFILLISLFYLNTASGQIDSNWVKNYTKKFSVDLGQTLPEVMLFDTACKVVSLKSFLGKTLYINIWATSCAPCIAIYPKEVELMQTISKMGLSDSVLFINICTELTSDKNKWMQIVKSRKDNAINFFSPDSAVFKAWNMEIVWPSFVLIDKSGKNLGKKVPRPDESGSGFMLFAAMQQISAYHSVWMAFLNDQSLKKGERNINPLYLEYLEKYRTNYLPFVIWKQQRSGQPQL